VHKVRTFTIERYAELLNALVDHLERGHNRGMTDRRRNMRASDADREQVVERLRRAADDGRLFVDEFDQRLGQALNARTYGELDAIVGDLPPERALIKRPGRARTVLRRSYLVSRAGRAGIVLRRPRGRALIAGALATVAVAVPLTVTGVGISGVSVPASHAPGGNFAPGSCTNHWTKTSKVLPCDWGNIVSHADAPQIVRDVVKANDANGS